MDWRNWLIVALLSLFSCLFNAGAWAASEEERPTTSEEMNINIAFQTVVLALAGSQGVSPFSKLDAPAIDVV